MSARTVGHVGSIGVLGRMLHESQNLERFPRRQRLGAPATHRESRATCRCNERIRFDKAKHRLQRQQADECGRRDRWTRDTALQGNSTALSAWFCVEALTLAQPGEDMDAVIRAFAYPLAEKAPNGGRTHARAADDVWLYCCP